MFLHWPEDTIYFNSSLHSKGATSKHFRREAYWPWNCGWRDIVTGIHCPCNNVERFGSPGDPPLFFRRRQIAVSGRHTRRPVNDKFRCFAGQLRYITPVPDSEERVFFVRGAAITVPAFAFQLTAIFGRRPGHLSNRNRSFFLVK